LTIDVMDIDQMSRSRGLDFELKIRTETDEYRFGGRGAAFLALRLRSLLLDPQGKLEPFEEFERDEPLVVFGDISVYLLGFLATRGEVILTDRRIRIRTTGGIESWVLGKRVMDARFLDIRKVERRGIRRALSITVDQITVAIGGEVSAQIASGLGAVLIDAEVPGRWNQHVGLEAVWDAQLLQGPRYIPGVLAVSTRGLHFTPRGRLDSAVGAPDFTIDLEDIYQLGLTGRGQQRLEICTEERRVGLFVEGIEARFDELITTLQSMDPEAPFGDRPLESISAVEADCFISGWGSQFENEEELRSLEWTVQWLGENTVAIGWLMLTTVRVIFLASTGEGGIPRMESWRMSEMGRLADDRNSSQLRFTVGDRAVSFSHFEGTVFVRRFWERCNVATVMQASQQSRRSRTLLRLEGRVAFVRMIRSDREVLRINDLQLIAENDGLSLKLRPDQAELLLKVGSGRVEVGRREGVYFFEARVTSMASLDEGEFLSGRDKIVLIALSQVQMRNQREGFRIDVSFVVEVTFSGSLEKHAKNCVVDDLSIGGVAMTVPWSLPHGVVAEFELPAIGEPLSVRARVVRLIQEGGGVRRWRYGMAFYSLDDVARSRINQLVLDQQRKRIRG
jgi:hypothetical protein